MGVPHLTSFLRPYANAASLAGQQVVIDGPAFAHQVYDLCLKAAPRALNALEAAPSYRTLADTAITWLDTVRACNVDMKRIYFDGFLPPSKIEVRLQRLQQSTRQLNHFHQTRTELCRASFPYPASTALSPFQSSTVHSGLTALPALSFLVPAIIEALKSSSRYAEITEVVPGEADLYCARYLKQHGGVVFTSDSDLLVHDLGSDGAVSFFHDIEYTATDGAGILRTQIFQPAAISKRLALPTSHGFRSLAFEIFMDGYGTFPKLLAQARSLHAIANHRQRYDDFLKEFASLPVESDVPGESTQALRIFRQLDPRTSEYVLHFPSLASIAGQLLVCAEPTSVSPHVFMPFLLGCPVRKSAWQVSTATRQLAYGLLNTIVPTGEQVTSVFEHRKQLCRSGGKELMLPEISDISEACTAILDAFDDLKKKLPNFTETQIWMALAVQQDIDWSISASKTASSQIFLRRMSHPKISGPTGYFEWDIVHFFAQLQGSLYSFRILQQITSLVVATGLKTSIPESVHQLHFLMNSVPTFADYPDLGTASSIIRKTDGINFLDRLIEVMKVLDCPTLVSAPDQAKPKTSKKKMRKQKRRRDKAASDVPVRKSKSGNPFAVLETE